jgi:hypothetical protein
MSFKHRHVPRPREKVFPLPRERVLSIPREQVSSVWRDKPTRKIVRDRAPLEADE